LSKFPDDEELQNQADKILDIISYHKRGDIKEILNKMKDRINFLIKNHD
jgi:hypothetical protein